MSDRSTITLSSGRSFYANNGILGIDAEGKIYEGYDRDLEFVDEDGDALPLTGAERLELGDLMIERWSAWRNR